MEKCSGHTARPLGRVGDDVRDGEAAGGSDYSCRLAKMVASSETQLITQLEMTTSSFASGNGVSSR